MTGMLANSPDNPNILKTGQWGKVSLVDQDTTTSLDIFHRTTRRGPIGLVRTLLGYRNASPLLINTAGFANHVFYHGMIGNNDTKLLTDMPYEYEGYQLSILMSALHMEHADSVKKFEEENKQRPVYDLGLYIADMFEVMPPELSARILMSSADPEISQATVNGERNSATEGVDILEMSVEGLVLLPNEARHNIFRSLAGMQPSRSGRASRLLSLIGADWYSHMHSKYSGYGAIRANLGSIKEPAEVHEFQMKSFADIEVTRKVIEEVINPS